MFQKLIRKNDTRRPEKGTAHLESRLSSTMAPLKIVICGGGVAGPALALWLSRSGHAVTVVERFPALRASGAQIDLRGQGIEVVKRMGLMDVIRSKLVDEAGVAQVDSSNRAWATILANKSGKGVQGPTSEYEIMRGDLVRILYDETKDKVTYIFGKTIERFEQDDQTVTACFSDGTSDTFDILVGADGQGSRIRKAILPANETEPYRRLGLYMAYWFNPRTEVDNNIRKMYHPGGGRMIMCRSHNNTETQAYFAFKDDSEEMRSMPRAPIEQQKEFWSRKFKDSGWQTGRFIAGMETTDNFYCQEILQVRTDTWSKGRVVLLADAAHCPSPMSGMGTTGAFVGAYVLAGEIARNSHDLPTAFANYDRTLRPFVDEIQNVNIPLIRFMLFPNTQLQIVLFRLIVGFFCLLGLPQLIARLEGNENGGWQLPDYPEIELKG